LCALCSCAPDANDAAPKPMIREAEPLQRGKDQLQSLCGRHKEDRVSDLFCKGDPPEITSLMELLSALGIYSLTGNGNSAYAGEGFALTGHSTSLSTRSVSSINPRFIYMNAPTDNDPGKFITFSFTRGEQFAEFVVRNRTTSELTFYLASFKQECNDSDQGCTPGDLLTPAVESDWRSLDMYVEDDLFNTPLDCMVCHQTEGPGTTKILRMQEFEPPWNHWLYNLTDGGHSLIDDYRAAKGDEAFVGIAGDGVLQSNPGLLSSSLYFQGSGTQPNVFVSAQIEREVRESAAALGGNQPTDNSVPGESPTWNAIYERAKRGEAISVPYHDVKVTDRDKLEMMTQAYKDFREGRLAKEELPDIRDVYPDDPMLLANMGFTTEPGVEGRDLLVQACSQCHNDRLDQTLSRARFNVSLKGISQDERDLAASRIMLAPDDPSVMPPARFRSLSDEAKQNLVDYLRK
jgi:hypothetical protein